MGNDKVIAYSKYLIVVDSLANFFLKRKKRGKDPVNKKKTIHMRKHQQEEGAAKIAFSWLTVMQLLKAFFYSVAQESEIILKRVSFLSL